MNVDGRAVANFILDFCDNKTRPITNLALQKIVFFCHVWSLIELRRPLIGQQFEAWQFGPVLQYLYREFKDFDSRPIERRARRINPESGIKEIVPHNFDDETHALLNQVVDFYSRLSASELVKLSHTPGGPWDQVWNHTGMVNPGMKITEDSLVRYYSKVRSPVSVQ